MLTLLSLSTGFLLGYLFGIRKALRPQIDEEATGIAQRVTGKHPKGAIIHPKKGWVKKAERKMEEAKQRGEEGIAITELQK